MGIGQTCAELSSESAGFAALTELLLVGGFSRLAAAGAAASEASNHRSGPVQHGKRKPAGEG